MYYSLGIVFFTIVIYLELIIGYFRIENNFHLLGYEYLNQYLTSLVRFDLIVTITFILIYGLSFSFYKKNKNDYIFIATSIINLIICCYFVFKNINNNYLDVFELNIFIYLIDEYGILVNILYVLPLILSIINIMLLILLRRKYKDHEIRS